LITYNDKTNLLELRRYKYSLQDIPEPNLYRDNYSYDEVPKVTFNYRQVPMNVPEEIWLTDTTFRDGQQSRAPYTAKQIATLYDMLHRLGGPKGKIRQCEFFLYSENDRRAIEACRELGYEFPEITGWIRATKEDFKLVKWECPNVGFWFPAPTITFSISCTKPESRQSTAIWKL